MSHVEEELGARVGGALRERIDRIGGSDQVTIDRVVAGARRRRQRAARTRIGVVCLVLVACAGLVLASRRHEQPPVDRYKPSGRTAVLPQYAVLTDSTGVRAPVSMDTERPGAGSRIPTPAVDVWTHGGSTVVVRTYDNTTNTESSGSTDVTIDAPATTAATAVTPSQPWRDRVVEKITVRGQPGAVEQLATDQFAVWIPQGSNDRYTLVIGRHITRAVLLADVETMTSTAGVLRPGSDFSLVTHSTAQPAGPGTAAFAQITYSFDEGPYLYTSSLSADQRDVETAFSYDLGSTETIGDKRVLVTDDKRRTTVSWVEPSGIEVGIVGFDGNLDPRTVVASVRLIDESQWVAMSQSLSAATARDMALIDSANIGDITIVRRQGPGDVRSLCLVAGSDPEACVAAPQPNETDSPSAQVEIRGHWYVYGYESDAAANPPDVPPFDSLAFTEADGTVHHPRWTHQAGGYWYVVRIPDGVDTVHANIGDVMGGVIGDISRPLIPSGV